MSYYFQVTFPLKGGCFSREADRRCPVTAAIPLNRLLRCRVDYYPTVVFLTTNKLAQVALGNWAVVVALLLGKLLSRLFLGRLRDIEVEVG